MGRLLGPTPPPPARSQDLPGALSAEDIAVNFETHALPQRSFRLQPSSALTLEGIEDGIEWLAREARRMVRMIDR